MTSPRRGPGGTPGRRDSSGRGASGKGQPRSGAPRSGGSGSGGSRSGGAGPTGQGSGGGWGGKPRGAAGRPAGGQRQDHRAGEAFRGRPDRNDDRSGHGTEERGNAAQRGDWRERRPSGGPRSAENDRRPGQASGAPQRSGERATRGEWGNRGPRHGEAGTRERGAGAPRRAAGESTSGGWRDRRPAGTEAGRPERPFRERPGSARGSGGDRPQRSRGDDGGHRPSAGRPREEFRRTRPGDERRPAERQDRAPRGERPGRPTSSGRQERAERPPWRDRDERGAERGRRPSAGRSGQAAPERRDAGDRRDRPAKDWRERRPSDRSGPRADAGAGRDFVDRPRRPAGPELPDWADPLELDPAVRSALRGLDSRNAEQVARHLVAAGTLVDEDPDAALEHARAARDRASRVAAVREAVGVAAYHAGDYAEAARELRAYRRMSGDESYRAVLADCERALGRPEVALRLVSEALAGSPDSAEVAELRLVEAGARCDLGETAAARLVLESALGGRPRPEMVAEADPASLRMAAAYADLLAALGEHDRAAEWAEALADVDPEGLLGIGDGPQVTFSEEELATPAGEPEGPPEEPAALVGADAESFAADVEAEVAELLGETEDGDNEDGDNGGDDTEGDEPPAH